MTGCVGHRLDTLSNEELVFGYHEGKTTYRMDMAYLASVRLLLCSTIYTCL